MLPCTAKYAVRDRWAKNALHTGEENCKRTSSTCSLRLDLEKSAKEFNTPTKGEMGSSVQPQSSTNGTRLLR